MPHELNTGESAPARAPEAPDGSVENRAGAADGELSISVVIPVHNGEQDLRQCLASVVRGVPPPAEIIVVDDGSTDGSALVGEEFGARVLRTAARGGPAAARNLGAQAAGGAVLLFVDADVVLPEDALALVAESFAEDPELAALFGSYDDDPPAVNFLSQFKHLSHHYFHQASPEDASTFFAACGAVRRSVFLRAGGFDESYRVPCVEDIELGYRLKEAGQRVRLCKALQVKHLKVWTPLSLLKVELLQRALPWTDLILRHRRVAAGPNLRLPSRLSVLAVLLLLVSLVAAVWWREALVVSALAAAALLALNAPLYLFLWRRRGAWFALKAIPWNLFYYFYGGVAFGVGLVRHLIGRRGPPGSDGPQHERTG